MQFSIWYTYIFHMYRCSISLLPSETLLTHTDFWLKRQLIFSCNWPFSACYASFSIFSNANFNLRVSFFSSLSLSFCPFLALFCVDAVIIIALKVRCYCVLLCCDYYMFGGILMRGNLAVTTPMDTKGSFDGQHNENWEADKRYVLAFAKQIKSTMSKKCGIFTTAQINFANKVYNAYGKESNERAIHTYTRFTYIACDSFDLLTTRLHHEYWITFQ